MYQNPQNPNPGASNAPGGTSQPSSSRPQTSRSQERLIDGDPREITGVNEWLLEVQPEAIDFLLEIANSSVIMIRYRSDGRPEMITTSQPNGKLKKGSPVLYFEDSIPLSERVIRLAPLNILMAVRAILLAENIRNFLNGTKDTLPKYKEELATLTSLTSTDSHPESDKTEKEVDEEDDGEDNNIDRKKKGKMKSTGDDQSSVATQQEMELPTETVGAKIDEADNQKEKQQGGNQTGKKKNKKRSPGSRKDGKVKSVM